MTNKSSYDDTDHEDDRWVGSPTYDPSAALTECLDLWGSGAWTDENAVDNLAEVMEHVARLFASNVEPLMEGY